MEEGRMKGREWRRGGWRVEEGRMEGGGGEGGRREGRVYPCTKQALPFVCVCEREEWERETLRTRLTRISLVSIIDIKVLYLDVIHHCSLGVCFYHLAPDSLIGSRTFGQIL